MVHHSLIIYSSDFHPFLFHGTRKLITTILWLIGQKIGVIFIHLHQMAIVVLAIVIYLFDNLRERGQCL